MELVRSKKVKKQNDDWTAEELQILTDGVVAKSSMSAISKIIQTKNTWMCLYQAKKMKLVEENE